MVRRQRLCITFGGSVSDPRWADGWRQSHHLGKGWRYPVVYTLLNVERDVLEVFNSTYDIRTLLAAIGLLRDGAELDIPRPAFVRKLLLRKLDGTEVGELFEEYHLLSE